MYSYPQLCPLDFTAIRGVAMAGAGTALLVAVLAHVLHVRRERKLWLFAFTASAILAGLIVTWSVSPALTFWAGLKWWGGLAMAFVIIWLLYIPVAKATQGSVTLIESLVFIGILIGLFWYQFPSHGQPAGSERQNQCSRSLRGIGVAIHFAAEAREGELIGTNFGAEGEPTRSWRVELLPFLDQNQLRKQYDNRRTWDAPPNEMVARTPPHPFVCPNNQTPADGRKRSFTAYLACTGPSAMFPPPEAGSGRGRRFSEILDGTSHTMMVVEACGQNVVWTEPRDLDVETVPLGINLPGVRRGESAGLFSSHDPSGIGVLMVDGTVRRLSADTDPAVLKAMLTIDGCEEVPFQ